VQQDVHQAFLAQLLAPDSQREFEELCQTPIFWTWFLNESVESILFFFKKRGAGKTSSPDSQNSSATNHFCTPTNFGSNYPQCHYENIFGFLLCRPPGSWPSQPHSPRLISPPDSWRNQGDARAGAAAALLSATLGPSGSLPDKKLSAPSLVAIGHCSSSRSRPAQSTSPAPCRSPQASKKGAPPAAPSSSLTPGYEGYSF
jgi:hypothetical protein